jgi:ribosomal protein L40E
MSNASVKEMPHTRPSWDVPKARPCLRCGASFHSEWSGERICSRCKATSAWKTGLSAVG